MVTGFIGWSIKKTAAASPNSQEWRIVEVEPAKWVWWSAVSHRHRGPGQYIFMQYLSWRWSLVMTILTFLNVYISLKNDNKKLSCHYQTASLLQVTTVSRSPKWTSGVTEGNIISIVMVRSPVFCRVLHIARYLTCIQCPRKGGGWRDTWRVFNAPVGSDHIPDMYSTPP